MKHDAHAEHQQCGTDRSKAARRHTKQHNLRAESPLSSRDVREEKVETFGPVGRHFAQQEPSVTDGRGLRHKSQFREKRSLSVLDRRSLFRWIQAHICQRGTPPNSTQFVHNTFRVPRKSRDEREVRLQYLLVKDDRESSSSWAGIQFYVSRRRLLAPHRQSPEHKLQSKIARPACHTSLKLPFALRPHALPRALVWNTRGPLFFNFFSF